MKHIFLETMMLGFFSSIQAQDLACPNIVFILTDDLGYGDLSALNNESKIVTPNIDKIAREGVNFINAHSSSSVSTPSRYGILTGRYNWRSTLKHGVKKPYESPLIHMDRTTMASMLRNQGYQTACIGKWHLGLTFATTDGLIPVDNFDECNLDFHKEIIGGPCDLGFDYFFGVDAPNFPPYCFIENRNTVGIPNHFYPSNSKMDTRKGRGIENWNMQQILPTLIDKAESYIEQASKKEKPFFLYLPLTSPHTPIVPTKEFVGKTDLNLYADFVSQTDASVGKILNSLKKNGIDKNTIVVFASDNGCSPRADFSLLNEKGHYPNYIFRGMKADLYEGGHHVPCLVRWPNRVQPHSVKQTICLIDFMSTFASLTGYNLSDNEAEDSYDILPLLTKESESSIIREATVHHSIDGSFSIRQGKWKLLLVNHSGGWSTPLKNSGYEDPYQLYNVEDDPDETNNLYRQNLEKAEDLKTLLIKYVKEGRSTVGKPQKNDFVESWEELKPWLDDSKPLADHWEYRNIVIEEPGYFLWGSSPILDEAGNVHLFAARWKTEIPFDKGWRSHCEIAHYVSDNPEGPFHFKDVVLKGTGKDTWDKYGIHNPTIQKVGDKYALLYISNDDYHQPPHPANQKIGMLVSKSVYGPWKKVGKDGCILEPSKNPKHWTYKASNGVVNPALLVHPNGGYLLYFKSSKSKMGVAFANKVEGPYVMYPNPVTKNKRPIEDGYAFIWNNEICLLTTDNHGLMETGGGLLWKSKDGINFDKKESGFHLYEKYLPKASFKKVSLNYGKYCKFERPQVLMMNGKPAYLYVPSGANIKGGKETFVHVLKYIE